MVLREAVSVLRAAGLVAREHQGTIVGHRSSTAVKMPDGEIRLSEDSFLVRPEDDAWVFETEWIDVASREAVSSDIDSGRGCRCFRGRLLTVLDNDLLDPLRPGGGAKRRE